MRATRASIDLRPWCTAAEPVAQAFSTRSARLKRSSGEACSTSEAVKSCAEKPALKWPSTISSTSRASTPASASAPLATLTIRLSTVSPSSLPNGVCAQPTMQPVITASCAEIRSLSSAIYHATGRSSHKSSVCRINHGANSEPGPLFLPIRLWFRYSKRRVKQHSFRGRKQHDRTAPVTVAPTLRFHVFAAALAATAITATVPTRAWAEATLLIEADSGKVLHAENATIPWYPASTSKLMTVYVTLQAVKNNRITLDTLFTVSPRAASQAPTKIGFRAGSTVTVDNALKILMVKSANDMAVLLAEGVAGSVEKFADEMNATSKNLGMTQSSWVNPNGLPADEQISSARDLAILARALIHDFPEYDMYWHIPAITLGKRTMRNFNTLIGRYEGADGMKTGFI